MSQTLNENNPPITFVTPAGTTTVKSVASTSDYDGGKHYNYTLVVQVPLPFGQGFNFNLLGQFVLPLLSRIGIPQALTSFIGTAKSLFDAIVEDVQDLMLAIPEATVTILVKVGPAVIVNVHLVAQHQPVKIPLPSFVLDLPNFAIDPKFSLGLPFPVPPPVFIQVPIPVPVPVARVGITGGNVSARATVLAPFPVSDPIVLPKL